LIDRLALKAPDFLRLVLRRILAAPRSRVRKAFLRLLLRRGYAAFNRRDWELNTILHHPTDYTWMVPKLSFVPPDMAETYHGVESYLEAMRIYLDAWEDLRVDFEDFIDAGSNRVIVVIRQIGVGRWSGLPVDLPSLDLIELRDGWLVSQRLWDNLDDALRSVGLPAAAR
jgi:ketosteroid isomerase-like protein